MIPNNTIKDGLEPSPTRIPVWVAGLMISQTYQEKDRSKILTLSFSYYQIKYYRIKIIDEYKNWIV